MTYEIKIPSWSATDYSFLVNETNGWVDDDQTHFVFENEEDYTKMRNHLERLSMKEAQK